MCKKGLYWITLVMILASVAHAQRIDWTGLAGDRLWSNPANWSPNKAPAGDSVFVEVPAAIEGKGPIIQSGDDLKISSLVCELAGEPTMTITGGALDIARVYGPPRWSTALRRGPRRRVCRRAGQRERQLVEAAGQPGSGRPGNSPAVPAAGTGR